MHVVRIGTSGYNYRDWKGKFYPEDLSQRKWLSYFSESFKTVEINATFYGSFKENTFENWALQVPDDFSFTIKGSRFITHIKRLVGVEESVERFFASAQGLGQKLSCVLWQLPANFQYKDGETHERVEHFLSLLPKDIRQAFELRHESWFCDEVYELLNNYHAGFVINDSAVYPWREKITGDFAYIRFHGPSQLYASKYSEEAMKEWAAKIKEYKKTYDVYAYFNNDFHTYAIQNARELLEFLS